MGIFSFALACGLIALLEAPPLLKKKDYKGMAVFAGFLIFAFSVTALEIMGVNLPNPSKGIEYIVKQIINMKFA